MSNTPTVRAGRRAVGIDRPEKILFPDGDGPGGGLTKADLADYHRRIAEFTLPRLRDRPLMPERQPDGVEGPRFMQKDAPEHYPDRVRRPEVGKDTRETLGEPGLTARRWSTTDVDDVPAQARSKPWAGLPSRGRALGPARRQLGKVS